MLEADKCALVHCYGSISRSAVLIIAYLMESKGIDLLDATQLMKGKWDATWYVHMNLIRHVSPFFTCNQLLHRNHYDYIRPNDSFVRQLIEFEKELQKERMTSDA